MFRNDDKVLTVLAWIHSVLLFAGIYLVVAGFLKYDRTEAVLYLLRGLWLFIPVISSWYFIWKCKSFIGYLAAGIGMVLAVGLISRCILTIVLSAVILLIRCYVRTVRGQMKEMAVGEADKCPEIELSEIPTILDWPKTLHMLSFVLLYFILIFMRQFDCLILMFWLLLAEVLICHVYNSLDRLQQFVVEKRQVANLPVGTIHNIGIAVLICTFLLLAVLLLPAVLWGEEPLTDIMDWNSDVQYEAEVQTQQIEGMGMEMGSMEEMLDAIRGDSYREPPAWLQTLSDILFYVMAVLGILIIVLLVFYFLRHMMNSFAKGEEEDEIIFLGDEIQEGVQGIRRKKMRERWGSPNVKIRKKYKKTIQKRLKMSPCGSETPDVLEEKAGLQDQENQEELQYFHEIYEKARYSQEECSREEAERYVKLRMKEQ